MPLKIMVLACGGLIKIRGPRFGTHFLCAKRAAKTSFLGQDSLKNTWTRTAATYVSLSPLVPQGLDFGAEPVALAKVWLQEKASFGHTQL